MTIVTGFTRIGKVRHSLSIVKGIKTQRKEYKEQNKKNAKKPIFTLFQATSLNLIAPRNNSKITLKQI